MKKIIILGSTGSIGTQTLEVVRAHPDHFQVIGLSAHGSTMLFEKQVREFKPKYVVQTSLSENPQQALCALAQVPECDLVVNAIAGCAGLMPTYAAVQAGKKIALANKESLVMAGELLMKCAAQTGARILPIDSEASGIWKLFNGHTEASLVEKVILTASGGPFWKWDREQLKQVSVTEALKHPTWKMGKKVSIDSATLMNKAFEIIEARWLFDLPAQKIDVIIHRQSTVHALVTFCNGETTAIMSRPDMKIPIANALFYPEPASFSPLPFDLSSLTLTFEKPDYAVFEGPRLAYEVLAAGGIMPAIFCLADEIAVAQFLKGEMSFLQIYDFIKEALERVKNCALSMEALHELPLYFKR